VDQWNDLDGAAGTVRGFRGGYWYSGLADFVSSSGSNSRDPFYEHDGLGFRLVSVPEIDPIHFGPALALVLGSLGLRAPGSSISGRSLNRSISTILMLLEIRR